MKIPLSRERQQTILQRQIDEILLAISDAKRQKAENFTIKQINRNCTVFKSDTMNYPNLFVVCMKILYRVYCPKDSISN